MVESMFESKWDDAQWRGSRGGRSVCGIGRLARRPSSDGFTLIEKTAKPNQEYTKGGTAICPLMRHKEWAAQKVVTTLEADAKSSDHLLTRSHEGGTGSTAGERLLRSSSTGSSLLGDMSLIGPLNVFSCTPASEHSVIR